VTTISPDQASVGTAASSGGPALEVQDLRVEFGGVHAVSGVSFAVPAHRITGLIGPNGAGKSTVLKMMAGVIQPTGGRIMYDGRDISGKRAYTRARLGLIRTFQLSSEFARLTVMENLLVAAPRQRATTFLGALLGKPYWRAQQARLVEDARVLLDEFEMSHMTDEYAGQLSGGQRRLVEIMRALMAQPKVLLLDEPLAGVNPTLRLTVEKHLVRLQEAGLTMLMVEHELGSVERCCESVIVMAQGRVLAKGSMEDLRANEEVVDAYLAG
jgi:ABC-type branched-subunit amino acid transport system ATPase component